MSDQDQTGPDHDKVLAGEYALGLLPEDEAAAFEARLVNEPELRALYLGWVENFALMADEIEPVTPPPGLQRNIESRLFGEVRGGRMSRLMPGWLTGAVAVAVVAAVIVFGTGLLERGPMAPENPVYHADIEAEDGSLIVAAGYDATNGELYVERRAGGARPGRSLELWLIAGENPPVSLGVLPEAERVRLPVDPDLRPALEGGVFAISDEPPGGSPTGAPTGDVLAVGSITKV